MSQIYLCGPLASPAPIPFEMPNRLRRKNKQNLTAEEDKLAAVHSLQYAFQTLAAEQERERIASARADALQERLAVLKKYPEAWPSTINERMEPDVRGLKVLRC